MRGPAGVRRTLLVAALAVAGGSCERLSGTKPAAEPEAVRSPLEDVRDLVEQGQLDAALAKLGELPSDAENLYLQGTVWARKAEAAPLPTPAPLSAPPPPGAEPPASPEFKPEELTALDLFERAAAARPDHAGAQLAIAELLAPHAARLQARLEASQRSGGRRGQRSTPVAAPAPAAGAADYRPDRVIEAYRVAMQSDPASWQAAQGLATFASRVGRLDEADAALRELIRRDKENPDQLVRYGDFLARERKDPLAAVDYYRQALIWRPDHEETRGKVADVFITMGVEHFLRQEYAVAEARFAEAEKYIGDRGTPRGIKIQDYQGRLRSIRPKGER